MAYGRVGHIEIAAPGAGTFHSGALDFRFEIDRSAAPGAVTASIDVCGLSPDRYAAFTSVYDAEAQLSRRVGVSVWAGYADEGGERLLYYGDISRAYPTSGPPDIWIHIDAIVHGREFLRIASISAIEDTDLRSIAETVAASFDPPLSLRWCATDTALDAIRARYAYTGDVAGLPAYLADIARGLASVVIDERGRELIVMDAAPSSSPYPAISASAATGLLGVPSADPLGAEFDMLLLPTVHVSQPVRLESRVFPAASGDYFVRGYTHRGELRGRDWTTHVVAIRSTAANAGAAGSFASSLGYER